MTDVHSCSYYCDRPECIKAQRDELRDRTGSMTDRELMRQVLEDICGARLCEVNSMSSRREKERLLGKAANALRERLAQPEHEAATKAGDLRAMKDEFWKQPEPDGLSWLKKDSNYFSQPQRKPLTDEEIEDIWADCSVDWDDTINVLTLARAIEQAHGIKGET